MRDALSFLFLLLIHVCWGRVVHALPTTINSGCFTQSCGEETVENGEICREISNSGDEVWSPCETNNLCLYDDSEDEYYCELVFGGTCESNDDCEFDLQIPSDPLWGPPAMRDATLALSCEGLPSAGVCKYPEGMPGDACSSDDDCDYTTHCNLPTKQCRLPIAEESCEMPTSLPTTLSSRVLTVFSIGYLPCNTDATVSAPAVCLSGTCQAMLPIGAECSATTSALCGVNGACNLNSTGLGVCQPLGSQPTGSAVSDSAFCMCGFRAPNTGLCQSFQFTNLGQECWLNQTIAHSSPSSSSSLSSSSRLAIPTLLNTNSPLRLPLSSSIVDGDTGDQSTRDQIDTCVVDPDLVNNITYQGMCGCTGSQTVPICQPSICDVENLECVVQLPCIADPSVSAGWLNYVTLFYYNPCPLGASLCGNVIAEPSAMVTATCALRPLADYSSQFLWCSNPFAACDVCDCDEDDDDIDVFDSAYGLAVGLSVGGFVLFLSIMTCVCRGGEIRHSMMDERRHLLGATIPPPTNNNRGSASNTYDGRLSASSAIGRLSSSSQEP